MKPDLAAIRADIEAGFAAGEIAHNNTRLMENYWDDYDPDHIAKGRKSYEALLAYVDQLEKALKPFASMYKSYLEYVKESKWHGDFLDYMTMYEGGNNIDNYGERADLALQAAADGAVSGIENGEAVSDA